MIELLYLVAGIMLTLAMDQVKVLTAKYVESQEERKKSLAT